MSHMLFVTVAAFVVWPLVLFTLWRLDRRRAPPLRYADPAAKRGQQLLSRITCRRCAHYGEWPTTRKVTGLVWEDRSLVSEAEAKDIVARGFDKVDGMWYCAACAADIRAYALETLV